MEQLTECRHQTCNNFTGSVLTITAVNFLGNRMVTQTPLCPAHQIEISNHVYAQSEGSTFGIPAGTEDEEEYERLLQQADNVQLKRRMEARLN